MSDSQKPDRCPCGGIMLADTEDWKIPLCHSCWHDIGEPSFEPKHDSTTLALAKRTEEMWKARAKYDRLMQQALAMREALKFYADVSTWNKSTLSEPMPPISKDADDERSVPGNKARQALEQFDEFMKDKK